MPKAKKKKRSKKGVKAGAKRDSMGKHLPVSEERKRVSLAVGGRTIQAPPPQGKTMPSNIGKDVHLRPGPFALYAFPQKTVPQSSSVEYRNHVDNAAAQRPKFRTRIGGHYKDEVNLSHYRGKDRYTPVNPRHVSV
jgi:hypothetical protein